MDEKEEESDINDLKALDLANSPNGVGWNRAIIESLEAQLGQCEYYKWAHGQCGARYSLFYKITENIVTIIQVLATGSALTDLLGPQSMLLWARILTFLLSGISIFALKFHSRENYMSRSEKHKDAATKWTDLCNEIDTHLRLEMADRLNAKVFKYLVNDKFTKLLAASPLIPLSVANKAPLSHRWLLSAPQGQHRPHIGPIEARAGQIWPTSAPDANIDLSPLPDAKIRYELDRYIYENIK
jgi:hypothetical protein